MAITAAMVKELREMTGAGMMDCKKALNETNGNMDEAVEFLRKNGQAKAEKKAARIAAEGLCKVLVDGDKTAAVVEVNSETDFVAPAGRPAVVSTGSGALDVPVNAAASALWFIGQATMGKGYPVNGIRGTQYGEYVIRYTDGTQQIIPLRDGEESATVFGLIGPTAFDPRAAKTSRAFTIDYDRNWEVYHTGILRIPTDGKHVASVTVEITDPEYFLLLYGITAED